MNVLKELPEAPEAAHIEDPDVSFTEKFGAAWKAETIRTDAWNYQEQVRQDLRQELMQRLPHEGWKSVMRQYGKVQGSDTSGVDRALMDEIGKARAAGDGVWQDLPASLDEFEAEIDRRRAAELQEAEDLLAIEGPGVGGFLGGGARAMTDPASLMLIPLGLGGSLARVVISEAILGAAG